MSKNKKILDKLIKERREKRKEVFDKLKLDLSELKFERPFFTFEGIAIDFSQGRLYTPHPGETYSTYLLPCIQEDLVDYIDLRTNDSFSLLFLLAHRNGKSGVETPTIILTNSKEYTEKHPLLKWEQVNNLERFVNSLI